MNKNLKRIISTLFAMGIFGGIAPLSDLDLMTTKAYADDSDGVTSIEIETSNGDERNLYTDSDCKSSDKIDDDELEAGNTYYATSPSDTIEVNVSGVDSNYVRVFNGTVASDESESAGSSIDLSSGTTIITVRVYGDDLGNVEYSNDSYISQYKIRVKYTGDDDIDDDEESDNVYLKSISIEGADIDFKIRTYTYDINIPEDYSKVTISARPNADNDDYDNYKVKINGVKVDQDEKYKDDVKLNLGLNVIEIKVEDDKDNERIYTLNITKGKVTNSNNSSDGNTTVGVNNKWTQVNGKWQYIDVIGNVVKNMWVGNYYLQANGDMATGWLNYSGSWYYLGTDGAKKIGWQFADGNWYYLDSQGKIKTGWFKDLDGKWYYLNSFGAMAYNTEINGYRLGSSGAWMN